jgi:hypothetical protein
MVGGYSMTSDGWQPLVDNSDLDGAGALLPSGDAPPSPPPLVHVPTEAFGAGGDTAELAPPTSPSVAPTAVSWSVALLGFGEVGRSRINDDGGGGPLPPVGPVPSPPPPNDAEELLRQLILAEGCANADDGARPPPPPPFIKANGLLPSRCERAELVLLYLRRRHEELRQQRTEEEAGEMMARLTRAFVLLCMLRLVIAQQQRRRMIVEARHAAGQQPVIWDRAPAALNHV